MERAAVAMSFAAARSEELGFGFFGSSKSEVMRNGDVGVEDGIELIDAGEEEPGELDGGKFAFAEEAGDFFDGCECKVGVGCLRHGGMRDRKLI